MCGNGRRDKHSKLHPQHAGIKERRRIDPGKKSNLKLPEKFSLRPMAPSGHPEHHLLDGITPDDGVLLNPFRLNVAVGTRDYSLPRHGQCRRPFPCHSDVVYAMWNHQVVVVVVADRTRLRLRLHRDPVHGIYHVHLHGTQSPGPRPGYRQGAICICRLEKRVGPGNLVERGVRCQLHRSQRQVNRNLGYRSA